MLSPVLRKVVYHPEFFIERSLPSHGTLRVLVGDQVAPFTVVGDCGTAAYRVVAGCQGEVVKLIPNRAVLIRTAVAEIPGVFSSGREAVGELVVATRSGEELLSHHLTEKLAGKVVVASFCASLEILRRAQAMGISGLVVGGLPARAEYPLPVLVTEGFGEVPLNEVAQDYLVGQAFQVAILSPERGSLLVGTQIPLEALAFPSGAGPQHHFVELRSGQRVQVFSWPFFGFLGVVESVVDEHMEMPSGVQVRAAYIRLDGRQEKTLVPIRNLGVLL